MVRKAPISPPATATIINFILSLGVPPLKTSQTPKNQKTVGLEKIIRPLITCNCSPSITFVIALHHLTSPAHSPLHIAKRQREPGSSPTLFLSFPSSKLTHRHPITCIIDRACLSSHDLMQLHEHRTTLGLSAFTHMFYTRRHSETTLIPKHKTGGKKQLSRTPDAISRFKIQQCHKFNGFQLQQSHHPS